MQHTPVLYDQQDESLWDTALIRQGNHFLNLSAQGTELTSYHLEAAIAQWHCRKEDTTEKWNAILQLYNKLLQVNYSPSVALNRMYALSKVQGNEAALHETLQLKLEHNHFYFLLLAELYRDTNAAQSKDCLQKAYKLARTATEKELIRAKMDAL
jgi:predicted RNA polymerase sigma factor